MDAAHGGKDVEMSELPPIAMRAEREPRLPKVLAAAGCLSGTATALVPLWVLWGFNKVPVGTVMRPMALVALLVMCAAGGLVIVLPLSLAALVVGWRRRVARPLAVVGVLLGFASIFGGFQTFNWIVATRHFVMED
jgi:hypothetical protein